MNLEQRVGQKLLLAFECKVLRSEVIDAFQKYLPCGVTLFRPFNIDNPSQTRALTDSFQRLARELHLPPLLIATDQEGGQLMSIGDGTPLPGNMALGAAHSTELARRAGEVLGRELSALGINVNYAPCADVNINPNNPVVGIRSFGEDPDLVGELAAALIKGMQSQGVAATTKHFPGHGDTASDSHHGLPTVPHQLDRLHTVEFPPFKAAIQADTKLVMTAHLGIPSIDGADAPPATMSRNILTSLLRHELGFKGVIITDALDMHAIRQGDMLGVDAVRAVNAGADLLLVMSVPADHKRVYESLLQAARTSQLNLTELDESLERIHSLKEWLGSQPPAPDLSVIQCAQHMQVANEIAEKSITLVRDHANLLPISLKPEQCIAVIVPTPEDLTPADTSSYITPKLADSLREYHSLVDEFIISYKPDKKEIASVLAKTCDYDFIVIGTINAFNQEGQAILVREVQKFNIPMIVVALRLPYDLVAFPKVPTYLCTYGILEPSMRALAKAVFGHREVTGRLPVSIPGLYEAGYHHS
ncbi:MAG TPA: glycoside hydrolase family 3 N-terminal domain-containing protein [Anaerolineales bacterium]|nr:glycoside hydrolase family 3 N-terminal domain-containing protein [Anaerolineales bacterium]